MSFNCSLAKAAEAVHPLLLAAGTVYSSAAQGRARAAVAQQGEKRAQSLLPDRQELHLCHSNVSLL